MNFTLKLTEKQLQALQSTNKRLKPDQSLNQFITTLIGLGMDRANEIEIQKAQANQVVISFKEFVEKSENILEIFDETTNN